jgi:serine/threonine protein kinase
LKKGVRFTEAQLIDVLRQVAQGLSHIHRKGLAHLDVKPENIYVDLQVLCVCVCVVSLYCTHA